MIKTVLFVIFRLLITAYSGYKSSHSEGYFWTAIHAIQVGSLLSEIAYLVTHNI